MNFTGKTAVVTGGSRGIGRAICLELARGGANVMLCYAGNEQAALDTAAACEALGAKAAAMRCDVSKTDEVKALVDAALQQFGAVHILVNNAGITRDGLLMTMKEDAWDQVLDTNLKGAFLTMKAVARTMMKQRYGRIVNLSSVVGLHGNAGQVNYAASKAGVIGMTKSLAKELASRGVTVNAVAPGFIDTDMTAALPQAARDALLSTIPTQRLGAAEEVAQAVAFLASDQAAYITGQVLAVDGGMSDNIRTALYHADYEPTIANKAGQPREEIVTLCGKHCESGDAVVIDMPLQKADLGDIVCVFGTGAYNMTMASNYNGQPRPAVVFVRDGEARVVTRRETYEDLYQRDL